MVQTWLALTQEFYLSSSLLTSSGNSLRTFSLRTFLLFKDTTQLLIHGADLINLLFSFHFLRQLRFSDGRMLKVLFLVTFESAFFIFFHSSRSQEIAIQWRVNVSNVWIILMEINVNIVNPVTMVMQWRRRIAKIVNVILVAPTLHLVIEPLDNVNVNPTLKAIAAIYAK